MEFRREYFDSADQPPLAYHWLPEDDETLGDIVSRTDFSVDSAKIAVLAEEWRGYGEGAIVIYSILGPGEWIAVQK